MIIIQLVQLINKRIREGKRKPTEEMLFRLKSLSAIAFSESLLSPAFTIGNTNTLPGIQM